MMYRHAAVKRRRKKKRIEHEIVTGIETETKLTNTKVIHLQNRHLYHHHHNTLQHTHRLLVAV